MRGKFLLVAILVVGVFLGALVLFSSASVKALDENKCLLCHGNPDLSKTFPSGVTVSLYVKESNLNTSAHRFIDCTTCHTSDPHTKPTDLTKLTLAQKCGTCHQYQYKQHLESIHGEQLVQGNLDVATCVDCHSPNSNPHNVIRVLEYGAPAYPKNIAQTCGRCHGNEALMQRYGIVEKVYESYMRSFHGKATKLGTYEISQLDKATCANCHGTHDIKSTNDPTAPVVGMENLAKTCEACHPGAGVKFASSFLGHKEASPSNFAVVHYGERFFLLLTTVVVLLGLFMVFFELGRWLLNRRKVQEEEEDD